MFKRLSMLRRFVLNLEMKQRPKSLMPKNLQSLGFEPPAPHTPADFLAYMRSESAKWQKVVKDANIKAE